MDALKEKRDRNIGLKKLVVRSCRVHESEYGWDLGELVEEDRWSDAIAVGSDYEGSDDSDMGELEEE